MSLDHIHASSRTAPPQGWTVVYVDDCGDHMSTHVDYTPKDGATPAEIVAGVEALMKERCGPAEIPEVLFVFKGRHSDLVGHTERRRRAS